MLFTEKMLKYFTNLVQLVKLRINRLYFGFSLNSSNIFPTGSILYKFNCNSQAPRLMTIDMFLLFSLSALLKVLCS